MDSLSGTFLIARKASTLEYPRLLNAIAVSDTISSGADVAGEASSYSPSTSSR